MTNAPTRIGDIAQPARDDMDVSVVDRLASSDAAVDADVHTVNPLAFRELPADLPYQPENLVPFVRIEIFDARDVPAWNHQRVPIRNRIRVYERNGLWAGVDDVFARGHAVTERARAHP